jgi:hypothetical protein
MHENSLCGEKRGRGSEADGRTFASQAEFSNLIHTFMAQLMSFVNTN